MDYNDLFCPLLSPSVSPNVSAEKSRGYQHLAMVDSAFWVHYRNGLWTLLERRPTHFRVFLGPVMYRHLLRALYAIPQDQEAED